MAHKPSMTSKLARVVSTKDGAGAAHARAEAATYMTGLPAERLTSQIEFAAAARRASSVLTARVVERSPPAGMLAVTGGNTRP